MRNFSFPAEPSCPGCSMKQRQTFAGSGSRSLSSNFLISIFLRGERTPEPSQKEVRGKSEGSRDEVRRKSERSARSFTRRSGLRVGERVEGETGGEEGGRAGGQGFMLP